MSDKACIMGHFPLVSILFVTWNRQDYILRAIGSIYEQSYPNLEIIIVDNNSTDNTCRIVAEKYPEIHFIKLHKNLGCPSARNVGVANCCGKYVYLMDDDGWFADSTVVSKCVDVAEKYKSLGAVCSRVHNVDDDTWYPENVGGNILLSQFHGTCVLLNRQAFVESGGFPDDFFRNSEEEFASLAMLQNGYYCCIVPDSVLNHENRGTAGKVLGDFPFYSIRNANRTALRLFPFPYNYMRVIKNMWNAIRLSAPAGRPFLLPATVWAMIKDTINRQNYRNPVSKHTYRLFRSVSGRPVETLQNNPN